MPETTAINPQFRLIDGLSVRYADSGGNKPVTAILTNPWPQSLFAYHRVWDRIAAVARAIAIDLPGFGKSERRSALLAPRAMGEFLIKVVADFELTTPHIVSPDVGTSAALFAEASRPGTFSSLTVGAGGVAFPLNVTGALKDFIAAPDTSGFRTLDQRAIIGGAIDSMEGPRIPASVREDFILSYEGDRFAESIKYVRQYPVDLPALRDVLHEIKTPVQLITGKRDGFVPIANEQYLQEHLASSVLHVLDAGHFVWEEAADAFADLVVSWITGGYADVP